MKRFVAATLALAACSQASEPGNRAAPAAEARPGPAASPTNGTPSAAAAPAPGALKTFRDWTVACDNVRRCTMASLGPEAGDFPAYTLEVARLAGPAGSFEIAVEASGDGAAPASLRIDDRRFALAGDALAGAAAATIAGALANGRTLVLEGRGGARLGAVSLAGASAALRYIDAEQGRAGTVTAAVATGSAAADTVPAAPAAPVVRIVPIGAGAAPSPQQTAAMQRMGECETPPEGVDWTPALHPLGGGKRLALVPCSTGAYNLIGALFVLDGERIVPAAVDAPSGFEETGADSRTPVHSVVNGTVEGGELTSYAKGRGLGDCGVSQRFGWDGERLRLMEQREMGECRGNPHYLRTWTARAERP